MTTDTPTLGPIIRNDAILRIGENDAEGSSEKGEEVQNISYVSLPKLYHF